MHNHATIAALLTAAALSGCASTPPAAPQAAAPAQSTTAQTAPPQTGPTAADIGRLETLVGYMTGSFDSADQATSDRDYFNIRLHMVPIWTDRVNDSGARWLYVEQAMADQLAKPYRQRIYRVSTLGGGRFKTEIMEIPGAPLEFAGAWKTPELFNNLKADDLLSSSGDGCALLLTDQKDAFTGGTHERDCLTGLRGAAYTTSEATFTRDTLISWDRGFDEAGKQVWGAVKGGYVFRRRSR